MNKVLTNKINSIGTTSFEVMTDTLEFNEDKSITTVTIHNGAIIQVYDLLRSEYKIPEV